MSDRVLVMHDGQLAGELPAGAAEEAVMALATGRDGAGRSDERRRRSATRARDRDGSACCTPHPDGVRRAGACCSSPAASWSGCKAACCSTRAASSTSSTRSTALGLVAIGQTMVILTGSLDLSVAYLIGLCSLVAAETMDGRPGP